MHVAAAGRSPSTSFISAGISMRPITRSQPRPFGTWALAALGEGKAGRVFGSGALGLRISGVYRV